MENKSVLKEKEKKNKTKKNRTLGEKIILRIVTIVCIAVILGTGAFFIFKKFAKVEKTTSYAVVENQLSLCQEIVAAKYRYSDIVTLKKSYMFSKSYSIIKYSGLIRAGIADLMECDIDISADGKNIKIKLPETEVLGNDITKLEVFDEQQSIFVPITTQEIFDEIEKAKNETLEEVIAEGFLKEAKIYAVRILTQIMQSLGFENIEIV